MKRTERMLFSLAAAVLLGLSPGSALALDILLTNDDGFDSPGITALHAALLGAGHNVTVVAPADQQSTMIRSSRVIAERDVSNPAIPVLQSHDIIQLGRRHLDDVTARGTGSHPVPGIGRYVDRLAGVDHPGDGLAVLLDDELELAAVQIERFVLVLVVLE